MKDERTQAILWVILFFGGFILGALTCIWQHPEEQLFTEIEMNVSAYCKNACCCQEWADGITASGVSADGLIIAAPRNYAFGTVMDVPGYGVASVQDRGGAIKGNKIDLLFPSHQEALNWGRKTLMVKVKKAMEGRSGQ